VPILHSNLLPSPTPSSAIYHATGRVTPHPGHLAWCVSLSFFFSRSLSFALSPQIADYASARRKKTGYLYNERASPEPSPRSGYATLPISYIPSSGSKLNADPKDRPTISVRPGRMSHSPRSISAFIPTSNFQFNPSPKGPSPGSRSLLHKRSRSGSSDGSSHFSGPSDKTHYDQESEGESAAVPAPPQKRRREEKKHQCPYCKKLFHRPVSLGVHINTHTGDKRTYSRKPLCCQGSFFFTCDAKTRPL